MVVKVGVIGTGSIGRDHVHRLAEQVAGSEVSAVFDVATDRATAVAASVGARAHASWTDLVDDAGVQAVLIASPGSLHAEQALACIAAGKPVLCEKPLATTTEDCVKVLEAETAFGRRLVQVGFMRRFDEAYRVVKAAIVGGAIGEPLLVHCVHRNAGSPPGFTSAMVMTDSAVHEVDAVRWLLGQEVVGATVVASRPSPLVAATLRDPQLLLLDLANGAVATVEVFVNAQYGYDVRCEVVGSTGAVSLESPTSTALARSGQRAQALPADWRVRFDAAYRAELQEWVDGLRAGESRGAGAWDGYAATAVAESALVSLAQGVRTAVSLVDRPGIYR